MITPSNALLLGYRKTALEKLFKATFMRSRAEMNDGACELGMLQCLIPPGSTTIDIGANVGDFSRRLSQLSKGGLVIAVEPQSMPRSVLTMAGFFNKASNILVVPVALGDTHGLAVLSVPIKAKGNVGIGLAHIGDAADFAGRFDVKKELVSLTTLDALMARIVAGPVSFIKIDVEGGELAVLRGAAATRDAYRPSILCEIDDREARFGATRTELVTFLTDRDYIPRRISDLAELAPDQIEKNTVFVPRETVIPARS